MSVIEKMNSMQKKVTELEHLLKEKITALAKLEGEVRSLEDAIHIREQAIEDLE